MMALYLSIHSRQFFNVNAKLYSLETLIKKENSHQHNLMYSITLSMISVKLVHLAKKTHVVTKE